MKLGAATLKHIRHTLVGGLDEVEHFISIHILRIIIPADFHIFSEGLKPPTSTKLAVNEQCDMP